MGFSNSEERSEPGTGASGRKRPLFFALWPDGSLRQRLEHDLRRVIRSPDEAAIPARNPSSAPAVPRARRAERGTALNGGLEL